MPFKTREQKTKASLRRFVFVKTQLNLSPAAVEKEETIKASSESDLVKRLETSGIVDELGNVGKDLVRTGLIAAFIIFVQIFLSLTLL